MSDNSVSTFNPLTQMPVRFTSKAIKHLAKQIKQKDALGIAFKVKESGCSGYKYLLDLAFSQSDVDLVYSLEDDVQLFISADIVPLIRGTEVDLAVEGLNSKLEFKNPNATATCGCGESFTVEQNA